MRSPKQGKAQAGLPRPCGYKIQLVLHLKYKIGVRNK